MPRHPHGDLTSDYLEHFQFEMLRISNHTACRFRGKNTFFRSTLGRAALCRRLAFPAFSNDKTLWKAISPTYKKEKGSPRENSGGRPDNGCRAVPRHLHSYLTKRFLKRGEGEFEGRGRNFFSPEKVSPSPLNTQHPPVPVAPSSQTDAGHDTAPCSHRPSQSFSSRRRSA